MAIKEEEIWVAKKYMKRCLSSPVFRKMQAKRKNVKYNNSWQKLKNLVASFGEDEENWGLATQSWGKVKW